MASLLRASLVMLFWGLLSTESLKVILSFTVVVERTTYVFQQPWFTTLVMFIGMSMLYPSYRGDRRAKLKIIKDLENEINKKHKKVAKKKVSTKGSSDEEQPLLSGTQQPTILGDLERKFNRSSIKFIWLPSLFDLIASAVSSFGLALIDASIYQLLAGSLQIIATTTLNSLFYGIKIFRHTAIAIAMAIMGLLFIFLNLAIEQPSMTSSFIGTTAVAFAAFMWSCQFSSEQKVLNEMEKEYSTLFRNKCEEEGIQLEESLVQRCIEQFDVPTSQIVAFEGIYGAILSIFIVLPILQFIPGGNYGKVENSLVTIKMIKNSLPLVVLLVANLIIIAFYNSAGQNISKIASTSVRTIIENLRCVTVFVFSAALYFVYPQFGEKLTKYTYIRVIGFVLMITASFVFKGHIRIPGLYYEEDEAEKAKKKEEEQPLIVNIN
ncbi:hypothetical protein PCE1_004633 [Barthelona sp. PCE]